MGYIIFHISYDFAAFCIKIKNIVKPSRKLFVPTNEVQLNEETSLISEEENETSVIEEVTVSPVVETKIGKNDMPEPLSKEEKENISELIKGIKIKLSRGEASEARARIVEGLSIDKFNKELNCLLASMYEAEKDYKKAEMIYKDIIVFHETDLELYLKL